MGLFSRTLSAVGFLVTLVALAALVLTPRTAAAQDKPWPKLPKPARVGKPAPPQTQPPVAEETKPAPTPAATAPPAEVVEKPAPALEAEVQRRARANPFPGSAPEVAAPPAGEIPVAGAATPTLVTPEVAEPPQRQPGSSTLERHRAALAPFGTWVNEAALGDLWLPDPAEVGPDFAPYRTAGHWALTDRDQWAWVSDFDWGSTPFHYGRWDWSAQRGWGWVPGTDWAPAWVLWRLGEPGFDYVGWAPAPPAKAVASDAASQGSSAPVLPFWYVPSDKLFRPNLNDHVITDRKLGQQVHQHSSIFAQHLAPVGDGAQLTTAGLAALRAASPTTGAARIPQTAIPKTRLRLVAPDPRREADDSPARGGERLRKPIQRGHASGAHKLRSWGRSGRLTPPQLRHRGVQRKQIRPQPRHPCRRWVRTWSGALRCAHR